MIKDAGARRSFPWQRAAGGATVAEGEMHPAGAFRRPMRTLDPQSLSKHVDRLYRAAWALCGSREDAEDLVQETFARVLSRPRVLQGDDELYYLMRVLRNTFLTGLRTASRRPVTGAELEDVVAADPRPTSRPEQAIEVREVYATIAQLPDDFRLAIVAVDVLGLSYREAARALRVREATLTTRLFRARKQVVERLTPAAAPERQRTEEMRREGKGTSGVLSGGGTP
ncbi:MAG TPA: RNA polymerase sigma factor [Solirubrobacteraceae bacterium]|jgi:RNA polymerase sigma-70 factor (ECF subfamily)|nr:RNA polymerase sigma factor [Solirubrobacteraceae bacterium]